jgi:short-subunit dehydrogenase
MDVVVTGASQGIGRSIALAFAGEGARVALAARSEDRLESVAAACRSRGGEALVVPTDVTDDAAVEGLREAVDTDWGAPDVLVNNAGAFTPAPIADTDPDAFREQVDLNLTAAFVVTKAFLPAMVERGSGHLVYMGSVASLQGYPKSVGYCAAKHGLLGLARTVREETKSDGVRVTTVLPGATRTPSWDGTDLPDERFMDPDDVARAVVNATRLSRRSVVEELLIRPQEGDV